MARQIDVSSIAHLFKLSFSIGILKHHALHENVRNDITAYGKSFMIAHTLPLLWIPYIYVCRTADVCMQEIFTNFANFYGFAFPARRYCRGGSELFLRFQSLKIRLLSRKL